MTEQTTPLPSSPSKNIFSGAPSFSFRNRLTRAVWAVVWAVFASWTPPPLHRWRIFLLRAFGAKIGAGCRVYRSVRVWYPPHLVMGAQAVMGPRVNCYNQGMVTLGERAIVSQGAHLCTGTHDIRDTSFQLVTRPITIGADAWIAAEAFVAPGVTCGERAVLGARGVAFADLQPNMVYRGNPAVKIKARFLQRDEQS